MEYKSEHEHDILDYNLPDEDYPPWQGAWLLQLELCWPVPLCSCHGHHYLWSHCWWGEICGGGIFQVKKNPLTNCGQFSLYFRLRVSRFLGRISMAVYLLHIPVSLYCEHYLYIHAYYLSHIGTTMAATLVISTIYTLALDEPLQNILRKYI